VQEYLTSDPARCRYCTTANQLPAVSQQNCTIHPLTIQMNTVKCTSTWTLIQPVAVIPAFNCDCLQKAVGPLHEQFKVTVGSWWLLWWNRDCGQNHTIIEHKKFQTQLLPTKIAIKWNYRGQGGAVVWGAALQAGSSRVRFPMVSLEVFIVIFFPAELCVWGRVCI